MTTTIDQATPTTSSWVSSENIQEIIDSFDDDLAHIQEKQVNGEYVKTSVVFDVLLDVRNKLTGLL